MNNQTKANVLLGAVSARRTDDAEVNRFSMRFLDAERTSVDQRPFSVFFEEDLEKAVDLATRLKEITDQALADGETSEIAVSKALDAAAGEATNYSTGVVQHALKLFMTHHDHARSVRIPSLMRRIGARASAEAVTAAPPPLGGTTTSPKENQLNWFREDPLSNEHHEHWHVVYPFLGFPRDTPLPEEQRQGEMFFYMHEQMLARYDAERLAVGLDRVKPFSDYRAPLEIGYDPGAFALGERTFPPRAANVQLEDIPVLTPFITDGYTLNRHEVLRDRFEKATADAALVNRDGSSAPLSGHEGSDALGATNEPSRRQINPEYYGNHHGMGHILISAVGNLPNAFAGIMAATEGNIRDPIFWRWHKHIDSLNYDYQETQPPHTFEDAPPLRFAGESELRSEGIALVRTAEVPDGSSLDDLASAALGGGNWDLDPASDEFPSDADGTKLTTVETIRTETRNGIFELVDGTSAYRYKYLWHEGLDYVFRVENDTTEEVAATLRTFLCPMKIVESLSSEDPWLNDRSLWIELDKFSVTVPANEKRIVCRSDKDSSVIRRPAVESPAEVQDVDIPAGSTVPPSNFYCDCGWPYHLLLPKGTDDGMSFALLVIATDGKMDQVPAPGACGSMSYCGAKDRYPDTRPMGYPFDRPLSDSLVDLVRAHRNFAMRTIKIQHSDQTHRESV